MPSLGRRGVLAALGGLGVTFGLPAQATSMANPPPLMVTVPATRERLAVPLFGPGGTRDLRMPLVMDWLARDRREGQWAALDRRLYDLIYVLSRVSQDGAVEIISGYRTPATNAMLAARSEAVAIRSLHMSAKALDFRIPGLDNTHVARIAWGLGFGGVGLYGRDFVHVDTGDRRRWGDTF